MSIYKMQLDPAVTVFSIPLDTSEQHETQTSLSGSCTIWSQKNPPGNHKKAFFWRVIGLISALPVVSVLIWCLCGGEGTDLMRLGELELCGTALCLPTASLQRWKCETLIDHFNWSLLCRTERSCGPARSQNAV